MSDFKYWEHTEQEVFDHVVEALFMKQRKRSVTGKDGTGRCIYRGPNGMKCAAGHCFPDDMYHPGMDSCSYSWDDVINNYTNFSTKHYDLIGDLQEAHDNNYKEKDSLEFVQEWETNFREVAKEYGLKTSYLELCAASWKADLEQK